MQVLELVILGLIVVVVLGLGFLFVSAFSVAPTTENDDTETTTAAATTATAAATTTTTTTTTPTTTSGTTSTDDLDQRTLMTAEDMIFCLTNDLNCVETDYKTCSDNYNTTYMSLANCESAKAGATGELAGTTRWCYINNECVEMNEDETNSNCTGLGYTKFQEESLCEEHKNKRWCYDDGACNQTTVALLDTECAGSNMKSFDSYSACAAYEPETSST